MYFLIFPSIVLLGLDCELTHSPAVIWQVAIGCNADCQKSSFIRNNVNFVMTS